MSKASPKGGAALARAQVSNTRLGPGARWQGNNALRVKVPQRVSPDAFIQELGFAIDLLRSEGIDALEGINVYFHPLVAGQRVVLCSGDGVEVDFITVRNGSIECYSRQRITRRHTIGAGEYKFEVSSASEADGN
jgi:hypothetical protein